MKKKSKKVNDLYTLFIHNKDGIKKEYTASIFNETVQYFVKSGFMPEYGFDIGRIECEINNLNEKVTIIHDLNIEGIEIKYQNGTFHKSFNLYDNRPRFDLILQQTPCIAFVGKLKECLDILPISNHIDTTHNDKGDKFMLHYKFKVQDTKVIYEYRILVDYIDNKIKINCLLNSETMPESEIIDTIIKTINWFQLKVNSMLDGSAIINKALHAD